METVMREGYSRDRSLGDYVEAHAARTPMATAVVFGDERLSYDDLNRRANQLARHLRATGAGTGSLVATFMDRSAEMIVAWLGIVKAGAAYVPLDPDYPSERLRFMLDDSAACAVITTAKWRPSLPPCAAAVVSLDEDREAIASQPGENLSSGAVSSSAVSSGAVSSGAVSSGTVSSIGGGWLAHVIYTSGSTGVPKGVCVPHRAVSRLVVDTPLFAIDGRDRVSQTSSAAFDAATFEVWSALLNGACLVIVPREVVLSPRDLIRVVRERQISSLFLTTAVFNAVAAADPRAFAHVRSVVTGGEAMSAHAAREVLAEGAPGQLVNAYGPTENGVMTTCHRVRDVEAGATSVPIGCAVDRTDVLVLDENLQPVPPGAAGELCTGGDGLADGYWNRPDIAADRFVPHPTSPVPGARLYRTGDRTRQLPDGTFEFLGRVDEQVKVRGHRIEPGEIEAALRQHPAVAEAIVIAREDRPGEKRLAAYLRLAGTARPSTTDLRKFVADRLPEYMVPSAFVVLDAMPVAAGGKVDRRALPAPRASRPQLDTPYVAPRTPVEEMLAGLWAPLLGLDELGVDDHFLELGGHSLLAGQIMARVNDTFGASLPIGTIFERPTVALMAERIAAIDRSGRPAMAPLARAPRGGPLPLAYSQEQVWFLNELEPGNLAYNFQSLIRFTGTLDVAALQRSLEEIVRRHEILRTAFVTLAGHQPAQAIVDPMPLALPVVDIRHLPEEERAREEERLFAEHCQVPFDLLRPPLARWALLQTADDRHVLIHVEHHLVHDGWSFSIFLRELKTLYQAFSKGAPSPLADPAWQFADYAAWQRQTMTGAALDAELDFWRQRLAGAPSALDLPIDFPRPEALSFRGHGDRFDLPTDLYTALRAFSRQEKVTLFMTMVAAFKALLWRYSGQEDVVIGSGMANRTRREFESVLGMFVNPVVMRTDLSGDPTFRELVQRVRDVALDAYAHQDTPFGKLVEVLQPERDPSRNPLFQVLFSFHDAAVPDLSFDGLAGEIVERHNGSAKFDLNVICIPRAEQRVGDGDVSDELGLTVMWEYNADLFERATAVRLFHEYRSLLRAATARPDLRLSELPFVAPAERERILGAWNATTTVYDEPQVLHALIEAQVRRTPENIALVFEGTSLTYAELNARANQLAHHLRRRGAGPETLVGVAMERSIELVVALLGILKAGAAYVPIDPEYPADRVAFMLEDAAVPVLLTQHHLLGQLPPVSAHVIALDADWERMARESTDDPVGIAGPDNLAYVIYTSGSTGRPKAAGNAHRGIVNRLLWMQDALQLTGADRVLQKTPFSFDVSVWEFFWPLLVGARLVVARPGGHQDPAYLADIIAGQQITTLHFVPSMLRAFLDEPGAGACRSLLRTVCSGEALPLELQERFFARLGGALYNLYGPTEAAVDVTWWRCHPDGTRRSVPIGRPIANTQIYLLDRNLQPVPAGAPGELHIGGVGVGRGYLRRPELTAARFIPDPFGAVPGARLYKTGDLARYRADGAIEFLGRIDHQVKLRGLRIELGEIEARLREHAAVRDAIVIARTEAGDTRLVAYVVPSEVETSEPIGAVLRAHLEHGLPAYMVPSAFVPLEALPLSPNGKVDRRALPDPPARDESDLFVAPRTDLEEKIADIWRQVLGVDKVGVRDYFFDLGGHSLKTVQIRSRLSEELGVDLPLRAAFEHPTIEQQAQLLGSLGTPSAAAEGIPRAGERPYYPVSRGQRRLWFLHQLDSGDAFYNRALRIGLRGQLDRGAFDRALDRLVERHEALRTRFASVDDEPVQIVVDGFRPPLDVHDLSNRDEADLHALLLAFESIPFSLETPPVRALLCRTGDDNHVFVLAMHHIATDGWSSQVLVEDLARLYEAERCGGVAQLDPLPLRYVDFAAWQQAQVRDGALRADEEYWLRQLGGERPQIEFPADGPPSGAGTHAEMVTCDAAHTARLADLARRFDVTTFMLRMAILQAFIARFTGEPDVLVGTGAAGRPRRELEGLAGFFVNIIPLRTGLGGDPTFAEVVERVRQTALDAYAHDAYPFDLLVERLTPGRDADRLPLIQVLFTTEPAIEPRTAGGVTFETLTDLALALAREGGAAMRAGKVDLSIGCIENGDELTWMFLFDGRRVSEASARRFGAAFREFVTAIVDAPDARLSDLPVLSPTERRRMLVDWNATDTPSPSACIHALVEAQARRTPDALAVACGAARLTYAELDRRANWLAHRLRAMGIRRESLVGIHLQRSPDLIVALLGTLKAGGAYLPLDPDYPRARLEFMLADAGVSVVITEPALRSRIPVHSAVEVLTLDRGRDAAAHADAPPVSGVQPHDLAYVIYTSGSTGAAKGIDVAHDAVCEFLHAARELYTPEDVAGSLAVASICFDFSTYEIYTPLVCGGAVVLVENAMHFSSVPPGVPVTAIGTVPSAVSEIMRAGPLPSSLRVVSLGGEPVPSRLVQQIHEQSAARVLNVYGPTEATVFQTAMVLPKGAGDPLPIGRPMANKRTYVLDGALQPVPVGVVGELYIGGSGLARGYRARPELTATRFIPDPFAQNGRRLYRTGDRVRYRADGAIEYVGRADHQVKLRGFRIELGEIEAALVAHGSVAETVVVMREDTPGDKRLVAYVVPTRSNATVGGADVPQAAWRDDDAAAFAGVLRRFVEAKLPPYMAPAAIVTMDELPRMPNGKIDRASLPAPTAAVRTDRVLPRTDLERDIAAIWQDVLGCGPMGIDDDVFELGAHSLMATRVHRRIQDLLMARWLGAGAGAGAPPSVAARLQQQVRELVAQEFPLRSVFDHPTVRSLAALVSGEDDPGDPAGGGPESGTRESEPSRSDAIAPVAPCESYPVSHAQQRIFVAQRLDPTGSAYNIVFPLRLTGALDASALRRAVQQVVDRHEALRTTIHVGADGELTQRVQAGVDVPWTVHDLSALGDEERAAQAGERLRSAMREPFDLEAGPLVRAELLRIRDDEHRLLLGVHHVAIDGRSWELVFDELATRYAAIHDGTTPVLAAPAVRYADYAAWQNERLADGRLAAAAAYWQNRFAGGIPELALPVDRPDPQERTFESHNHVAMLDRATADRLRAIARETNATPFIVYLALVNAFLRRITGQDDIVTGTPVAAREHPDLDRVVGCFTNTVLVRTSLAGDPRFADLVAAVRSEALEAYGHGEYPLDALVQQLDVDRAAERASLVQAVFSVVEPQRPRTGGGVEFAAESVSTLAGEAARAVPVKFDFLARAIEQLDGRVAWVLDFSADLFDAATARRLARWFETFVASLVSHPDAPLSALAVLTEEERDALKPHRAAGRTEYPLAFNQQETWAQCQLHPGTALHNAVAEVNVTGPLDAGVLQDALQAVVDRHEALRTSFQAPAGVPVQRVERVQARLGVSDLSDVPPEAQAEYVARRSETLAHQPFALDRAPLFRAEVVRLEAERHVFIFVFHQLVLDAPHVAVFLSELASTYGRFTSGDRRPADALPLQFGDIALARERALQSGVLAEHETYWRSQLRAPLPAMAVPADRQPSAQRTFENGHIEFCLARSLSTALAALARRHETTTFEVLTAAFAVLLARLTGETDLLLALSTHSRGDASEGPLGSFANMLPVRTTLDPGQSFTRVLAGVSATARRARVRGEVPLARVLRGLGVERDLNRALFSVGVSQGRCFSGSAGPVHFATERVRPAAGPFDLWLAIADEDELRLTLQYATELFDRATAASFVRAFEALAASVAADAGAPIRELSIVAPDEAARVMAWGDASAVVPAPDAVAELARVVARQPHAIAVVAGATRWTYAELQDAAGCMSARLRAAGIGREDRVGLLGARSPGMLATVVGVLQAGAAFVPLEEGQPDARLQAIVSAAGLAAIVADRACITRANALAAASDATVMCWDDLEPGYAPTDASPARPGDLAYIFYTSGSTGAPKGVMVERGAMANHLRAKVAALGLTDASVVAQTASYGFDIVVWQWLAPLIAGGRTVIYDDATAEAPKALLAAMARDSVTVVETVPSFLEALVDLAEREATAGLPALEWMVSNAEALPPAIARRWLAQYPATRLMNTCGATECADDTTHVEVTAADCDRARVPVGRPAPGVTVAVVDDSLRLVPPGCVGEIVYGGAAVGRGYVGDAVATARAFVPDARSAVPGRRWYRTGDRGRWRTDGVLECLGRIDDQVKVHGYRVELGEVEAALAAVPGLAQVAAAVRTDARGRPRLVAYYVAPDPCEASAVRQSLAARLPAYMLPDAIVRLSALPRTRTGKLDRAALPPPPEREPGAADAPATELEAIVASVWRDVLQVPFVGRDDNFFDLGGHSLTAIRIVAALGERLGRRVSIRQLFMTPTLGEFADAIDDAPPMRAPALVRVADRPWYPISTAQRAQWVMHRMSESRWYPPRVLQLDGAFDRAAFERALQALVDRHDALRTTFEERDGEAVQNLHERFEIGYAYEDLSDLAAEARGARLRETLQVESSRPFDLSRLPLFEVGLTRLERNRHLLRFRLPHIITDGWTEGIVASDLAELYSAHCGGRAPSLPPLPVRHVDFCAQQQEWLATPALEAQKEYWLRRFAADVPALQLPTDPPLNPGVERHAAFALTLVDEPTMSVLRQVAAASGTTLFVAMLSAFKVLLARLSGQADVVVGTTVAARGCPELERVAGVFANVLPLRTSLAGNPRFVDVLRSVGETTLAGLAHQDYPLVRWVEELRRRRGDHELQLSPAFFNVHEEAFAPSFENLVARWVGTGAFGTSPESRLLPWNQRQQVAFGASETERGWQVELLGDARAFAETSLDRMLAQWIAIVRQVSADPERRLADIELPDRALAGAGYTTVALDRDEIEHLFA